jgi:hypothetical protein
MFVLILHVVNNFALITLVLTLFLLLAVKFLDLMSGKMVPRRLSKVLIWISLTLRASLRMKKEPSRMKLIESSITVTPLTSISWIKRKLKRSSDSISTRVVSFLEILSV